MSLKIDRIQGAYSMIRISGLTVNPTPEDQIVALDRMENMMSEFSASSLCTSYNFEESPDPNSTLNVDRRYWNMIESNLAVRLIPDFNKAVPPSLFNQANQSYSKGLGFSMAENAREVPYPRRMARGSGNTLRYNRWQRFQRPVDLPPNKCATNKIFVGDVNDYTESLESYLASTEVISSYTIASDSGLIVVTSANNSPVISYRVRAENVTTDGVWQQVKIVATMDSGRVETRAINFEVLETDRVGNSPT